MWPFSPSTTTLACSGLLEGATDWHSHILPGVDDGIKTIDETFDTLRTMKEAGVARVYLTPHIMEDVPNTPCALRQQFDSLCKSTADVADMPELALGAENMLDTVFMGRLTERDLIPISASTPGHADTLLVETSFANPPMGLYEILSDTLKACIPGKRINGPTANRCRAVDVSLRICISR